MSILQDMSLVTKSLFSSNVPKPSSDAGFVAGVVGVPVLVVGMAFGGAALHASATIAPEDICDSPHAGAKVLCLAGYGSPRQGL